MWWSTLTPAVCFVKKTPKTDVAASGSPPLSAFVSFRIGVLCSYAANQNLSSQVKNIRRLVNSNMRDLHTFANDTPMVSSTQRVRLFPLLCVPAPRYASVKV